MKFMDKREPIDIILLLFNKKEKKKGKKNVEAISPATRNTRFTNNTRRGENARFRDTFGIVLGIALLSIFASKQTSLASSPRECQRSA